MSKPMVLMPQMFDFRIFPPVAQNIQTGPPKMAHDLQRPNEVFTHDLELTQRFLGAPIFCFLRWARLCFPSLLKPSTMHSKPNSSAYP